MIKKFALFLFLALSFGAVRSENCFYQMEPGRYLKPAAVFVSKQKQELTDDGTVLIEWHAWVGIDRFYQTYRFKLIHHVSANQERTHLLQAITHLKQKYAICE